MYEDYIKKLNDGYTHSKSVELKDALSNGNTPLLTEKECRHIQRMFNEELRDCQFRIEQLKRKDPSEWWKFGTTLDDQKKRITVINEICYKLNRYENFIVITDNMIATFISAIQFTLAIGIIGTEKIMENYEFNDYSVELLKHLKNHSALNKSLVDIKSTMLILANVHPEHYIWEFNSNYYRITKREVYDIYQECHSLELKNEQSISSLFKSLYQELAMNSLLNHILKEKKEEITDDEEN